MKATWCVAVSAVVLGGALEATPVNAQAPCPWPAPPQLLNDRPSLPDSAMVQIGTETVKVCYSRPSARGRVIFGELVPFERPWRTGANEPTMLHLPARTRVADVVLAPGTYVLLTEPAEDSWEVLFNTSTATDPNEMFDALTEVARVTVPVEAVADPIEILTMRFEGVSPAMLVIEWQQTRVRVPIDVVE